MSTSSTMNKNWRAAAEIAAAIGAVVTVVAVMAASLLIANPALADDGSDSSVAPYVIGGGIAGVAGFRESRQAKAKARAAQETLDRTYEQAAGKRIDALAPYMEEVSQAAGQDMIDRSRRLGALSVELGEARGQLQKAKETPSNSQAESIAKAQARVSELETKIQGIWTEPSTAAEGAKARLAQAEDVLRGDRAVQAPLLTSKQYVSLAGARTEAELLTKIGAREAEKLTGEVRSHARKGLFLYLSMIGLPAWAAYDKLWRKSAEPAGSPLIQSSSEPASAAAGK